MRSLFGLCLLGGIFVCIFMAILSVTAATVAVWAAGTLVGAAAMGIVTSV